MAKADLPPHRPTGTVALALASTLTGTVLGIGVAGAMGLLCVQFGHLERACRKAAGNTQCRCFEHRPPLQRARILVLGDSTGVGVGAADPRESLAGLLATEFPNAEIVNASVAGARIADVLKQCREQRWSAHAFDLVLLHAGGNDVLRLTGWSALTTDAAELLEHLRDVGKRIIWMGVANIGLSPLFIAPFSWWMSARTRKASRLFAACARSAGVEFIDFFSERRHDVFSRECGKYYAADGLHPSSHSYRYCYEVLKHQTPLAVVLQAAAERRRRPRPAADLPPLSPRGATS